MSDFIETNTNDDGIDRRGFLKCMAWAGTGVIWSINGGLLTSTVLGQEAKNLNAIATAELNFVQISDSHIGFNKPANTDVIGTFRETIMHINALPKVPEFLLHTGDLTIFLTPHSSILSPSYSKTAEQRMYFMYLASTTFTMAAHYTGNDSGKIRLGLDGTVLIKKGSTSLGWSTWQISRRAAWALWARNNSTGLKKT
jgi:hypothetical protein